ncbi:MAG: PEP-CTERM sorting domain-containing protein [Rubrivivax sp.]|nr:MAG: PEP-CTERM sorting domain-containing protein [Rubrivivax sp.]
MPPVWPFNIQSGNMHMLKTFHRPLLGIAAAVMSLASLGAHAAPQYKVTALGLLPGGTYASAYAINDSGTVVGYGNSTTGSGEAFRWSGGTFSNLTTQSGGVLKSAYDINNAGTIVGGSSAGNAITASQGTITSLPNLPGASGGYARGINQAGTVVGTSGNQAAIWKNGQVQALGGLVVPGQTNSSALAINDSGTVAGNITVNFTDDHPVIWSADGTPTELEVPPTIGSRASVSDLNNAGVVVGTAYGFHDATAMVWRNGVAQALKGVGYEDSEASAINDAGQIVGITYQRSGAVFATLWLEGQAYNLNDLLVNGQNLGAWTEAVDINASGQILAIERMIGRVFVLTPVPEPSTYALIGAGLLSLLLVRRQRSAASGTGSRASLAGQQA